ncbi:MAG: YsnF/AvaK domain-containing protein [Clostridiales bacterium]|uniref:YsnF/AvaK domain-containing protein n=1 Tax=Clostridium sp. N3C TaxID=1776758 RepID=UPI00092E1C59|nr:YsnF/AvaK domain-containing protein [Clostridium sp. N3C]NLZ49206.1 YsnF/AvaK domain-containing protein [Clostridiales bacterium]SCN22168.1 Stress response protein YsnF [Clostridium sp. N3C]
MDKEAKDGEVIANLQLKEEHLSIAKKWVQTGEVEIYKESVTIEKTIKVPIVQEQLVIQKKSIPSENPNAEEQKLETIRIPLKEEKIEIIKHPIVLQEVEIYNKKYLETQLIEESIKKEKLNINTSGKAVVTEIKTTIKKGES